MGHYEELLKKYGLDPSIFSLTGGTGHPGQVETEGEHHETTEKDNIWNFPPTQQNQADDSPQYPVKCSQCQHAQLTINNGIFWHCNLKDIDVKDGNVPVYCSEYLKKD